MVVSPRKAFYLPQFIENPHTLTDIFTTRHITPKHQKLTVAKTLLSRVNTHITDNTQKHSELQNISSTLRLNGFPTRTTFLTSRQPRSQNTQYIHFISMPYIQCSCAIEFLQLDAIFGSREPKTNRNSAKHNLFSNCRIFAFN